MGKRKSSPIDCAYNTSAFNAAARAAAASDTVVVAAGIDGSFEGENGDYRAISGFIGLPGSQLKLVQRVAEAAKQPITVIVTGSSLDLTELKDNPKVGAIIWRGYAGEAYGQATADALFGAYSPSGRLTSTFYPQEFISAWRPGVDPYTGEVSPAVNASFFDMGVRPNSTTGNPGRTHRFYTGKSSFGFGDGLSYMQVEYTLLSPTNIFVPLQTIQNYATYATERKMFRRDASAATLLHSMSIQVRNTGDWVGAHSVLSFISPPAPGVNGAPLRSLTDFEKIWLGPNEQHVVSIPISLHDLTVTAQEGGRVAAAGDWKLRVGELELTITVK